MRSQVRLRAVLLPALLIGLWLGSDSSRLWAQCPSPNPTVSITSPANNSSGVGGVITVQITLSSLPAGYSWTQVQVRVLDTSGFTDEVGNATLTGNSAVYQWDTSLTLTTGSTHLLVATGTVNNSSCLRDSNVVTVTAAGAVFAANTTNAKVTGGSPRCPVCTGSQSDPLSGGQSWSVPITSWDYKGATFPFALTYHSISMVDHAAPTLPEFNGLSERNSKWSHPYAQWVDMYADQNGTQWAIWHRNGQYLPFQRKAGGVFVSPDSGTTMTGGGGPITSPPFNCNGVNQTQQIPYGYLIIKDADQTEYDFNVNPQTNPVWETGNCQAIPQFLLTRIVDRWGRVLNVTWGSVSVNGGSEPRVTSVMDGGDPGIGQNPRGVTLTYSNGLLTTVQDPQGRTHTLAYSPVPDEEVPTVNREKLTGVTVYGPGSPNRVVYTWSFLYQAPGDPTNQAYGGTYTGDLVVQKTEPDGMVTSYQYEPVNLTANYHQRLTPDDWDGRVTQVSWMDDSQGTAVQKVITRTKNAASQFTLSFPSDSTFLLSVQYNYSGIDVSSVVDLATNRTWAYTYDNYGFHNLTSVRSPLEATGNPLAQYTPTIDPNDKTGHISQMVEQVLQEDGSLGDSVTTTYNSLNLPTQVVAAARTGSGHHDQATQFQYDGGTLTQGKLTAVSDGWNDNTTMPPTFHSLQETDLTYFGANGVWGLPDTVKNPVGGVSSFAYDNPTGRLLTATSPQNLVVLPGHPDRPGSVVTLQYNSDGLPSLVQDPMGHQESISYSQDSSAASNLLVVITHVADGSARSVVLDPEGKALKATDENGVITAWTYNPKGQVVEVQRAFGTEAERDTLYHYNAQGDLDSFTPPNGIGGTVSFDYRRYNQDGTLATDAQHPNGFYEGQVTKISYPVTPDFPSGTAEYVGYNNAGELAWRKKQDGSVITITRDVLHRIKEVDYPAGPGGGAFSVTARFDEFGRTSSSTDAVDTTLLAYL